MSNTTPEKRKGVQTLQHRFGKTQVPLALGMTFVWMLLFNGFQWRQESLGLFVLGFLVSITIIVMFPMPPITPGFRLRPLQTVWMVSHISWQMILAGIQVSIQIFRRETVKSSVIKVSLRTASDLMLVCTAIATTVIPGSVVIEVAPEEHVMFVHFLGAKDKTKVEEAREGIFMLEERIVRALGTGKNVADLNAALAADRKEPV